MRRLLHAAADESGVALVTAIVLTAVMLTLGAATLATIDTQNEAAGVSRMSEASFNLAEAAMNAQVFQLSQTWPGKGMAADPAPQCTAETTHPRCPAPGQVTSLFAGHDVGADAAWVTSVHDNAGGASESHYDDATTATQPGYDANGDGKVWIRSQANVRGRTRTLVALVRAQEVQEDIPRGALISGRLEISNNGRKTIIEALGGSTESGVIAVRCTPTPGESLPCLGHKLAGGAFGLVFGILEGLLDHQISPNITQYGVDNGPAMTVEARARLKARAVAEGTYWASGCPPASELGGAIVYIENGDCTYTGNATFNSEQSPGMVLIAKGSLTFSGTTRFHGIVYHANELDVAGEAVRIHGNARIQGGVLVDGPGITVAGSSKLNIQLDPNAFSDLTAYGSAGIVQNTWREINPAG